MGFPKPGTPISGRVSASLCLYLFFSVSLAFFCFLSLSCLISVHSLLSLSSPHRPLSTGPSSPNGLSESAILPPECCPRCITYPEPLAKGSRNISRSGIPRGPSSSGSPSWLQKESLRLPWEVPQCRSRGARSRNEPVPTSCLPETGVYP